MAAAEMPPVRTNPEALWPKDSTHTKSGLHTGGGEGHAHYWLHPVT